MNRGYLKLYRKIQDNWMWEDKPFSFGHAWIDLLLVANIKETRFVKRSQIIIVKRGQIAISTKGFADRWGWSRGRVDRFLKQLQNEHQIEHQKNNVTTLITILNYDDYNLTDTKTNTERTPNEHRTDTSKEVKKVKKETYTPNFNEIWKRYPNKDGKKQAERHFLASVKTEQDFISINTALDKYLAHLKTEDWKKPKNGSTWFNNWSDWSEWEEPKSQTADPYDKDIYK